MKILYDHQAFVMQSYGGVSRCFAELCKHLPQDVAWQISLLESDNAYMQEMGIGRPCRSYYNDFLMHGEWPAKGRIFNLFNRLRGIDYWNREKYNERESVRLLEKGNYDVFHPTFFDPYYLPYLKGKPFVLTVHDMISELYPQYFPVDNAQTRGKKLLAPLAAAIVAVSESTKKDVVRILHVPEDKVHVVYHGCSFSPSLKANRLIDGQYVLYVGNRYGYKNFDLFVRDMSVVMKRHPELKVVCTGSPFNNKELILLDSYGVKSRFVHWWAKSDEDMHSLYHYAVCFVYSSEYEGFGIPILEAYKSGCPVMLNRVACFREIAGDAAIYFEMRKEHSTFAEEFERLYSMPAGMREDLLKKQRTRLSMYSWDKSASQMAQIYESIL